MKLLKIVSVAILGPLLGAVLGILAGVVAIPTHHSEGRAPGDGFLIIMCAGGGIALGFVVSCVLALWIWRGQKGDAIPDRLSENIYPN
jgi:hypothetical protein